MSAPRAAKLAPGTHVAGRYVVVAHLGSGGMGDVYEVEHTLLGRRFALKRLLATAGAGEHLAQTAPDAGAGAGRPSADGVTTADRELVARFLREARAAAATGHPCIVDVTDLGFAEEGWPFLVMERLRGVTLRGRLRGGAMREAEVLEVARGVLDALEAAHARGIVHRDLKPENLFLPDRTPGSGGAPVKILDFGLAQLRGSEDLRLTRTGAVMGTPLYMSPEQARGRAVDGRSDLYSLGALLFECLAGAPPFGGETYAAVMAAVLTDAAPAERLAKASPAVREAVLRALEKDPERRFPNAWAMKRALEGLPWETGSAAGPLDETDVDVHAATFAPGALATPPPAGAAAAPAPPAAGPTPPTVRPGAAPAVAAAPAHVDLAPVAPPPITRRRRATLALVLAGAALFAVVVLLRLLRPAAPPLPATAIAGAPTTAGGSGSGGGTSSSTSTAMPASARTGPATVPSLAADPIAVLDAKLTSGDLDAAAEILKRAALRTPSDWELRARSLALALFTDRPRAYEEAKAFDAVPALSPRALCVVAAVRAFEAGRPLDALPAVEAELRGAPGDLTLGFLRARLLRAGDRFDDAQAAYLALLARWPAFAPAVNDVLERLLIEDRVAEARAMVERYIAAEHDDRYADLL
ncbi:MAG TPA: serine/threonine-protein kinase, partial [Myxococcota bacterium]|nr:serine/threonine-protein kinase [Myxococcota bacterium]